MSYNTKVNTKLFGKDGVLTECNTRIGLLDEFNFPVEGDIGIKRQHAIKRGTDSCNPINIEMIVFTVNGKEFAFKNIEA